jgi:hypothetical protein
MNANGLYFVIRNGDQMTLVFAFVFEDVPEAVGER